jgi:hypothetical protein
MELQAFFGACDKRRCKGWFFVTLLLGKVTDLFLKRNFSGRLIAPVRGQRYAGAPHLKR